MLLATVPELSLLHRAIIGNMDMAVCAAHHGLGGWLLYCIRRAAIKTTPNPYTQSNNKTQ